MWKVLQSWSPGRFDASSTMDGTPFDPTEKRQQYLSPPAFGLAGVNLHTWTGWGGVGHWKAFVANLEMHGKGTFFDPRLDDATQFPVAAKAGFGHVKTDPDLITAKLPALYLVIRPGGLQTLSFGGASVQGLHFVRRDSTVKQFQFMILEFDRQLNYECRAALENEGSMRVR